ncbi:hypothetical protein NGF19_20690 [Streptomyces sp. RY43-2]|uniref:Integral membrane protein n=1 Tax=Streptomyces macrolidinus TaxID=2952607 RepID=A0ABT0ZI03_9ACTN|nr:hypothetical protein [Streptomyces macrolidinus]MCN9243180.1 hypothetical protein [Streptomyces macrolidinus]
MSVEMGAQAARSRALAVLRVRGRALAAALLPAAVAVVLLAGGATGHLSGGHWTTARWITTGVAVVVLLSATGVALVVSRARPAMSPTVPIAEESAPDLYRMVRDLADRLDVPAPSAIALTPDCDSWLEDRTHPAHGKPASASARETAGTWGIRGLSGSRQHRAAPVLVIGSPFLWWMRVGELRAVLAPVVAGTGPSAHPDIAAARRFVRGLDAAVAVTSTPGRGPLTRTVLTGVGWVVRLMLRSCRGHAAEMERGVAAAAAVRAQTVDYGLRIVAQEQVGLAYAGWDRLLTRVALPAWRMGRWPSRLDAGVVAALTELSRRDRLAESFTSRLGERPACDLLEEPGIVDEAASLLAARLFHGGPARPGPDWAPVDWQAYPDEVVDRKWRTDAARLQRVLDTLGVHHTTDTTAPDADEPTLDRVLEYLTVRADGGEAAGARGIARAGGAERAEPSGQAKRPGRSEPVRRIERNGQVQRAERASGGAVIPETAETPGEKDGSGDDGPSSGIRARAGGAPEGGRGTDDLRAASTGGGTDDLQPGEGTPGDVHVPNGGASTDEVHRGPAKADGADGVPDTPVGGDGDVRARNGEASEGAARRDPATAPGPEGAPDGPVGGEGNVHVPNGGASTGEVHRGPATAPGPEGAPDGPVGGEGNVHVPNGGASTGEVHRGPAKADGADGVPDTPVGGDDVHARNGGASSDGAHRDPAPVGGEGDAHVPNGDAFTDRARRRPATAPDPEGAPGAPDRGGDAAGDFDGAPAVLFAPDDESLLADARTAALLAGLSAEVAREEAAIPDGADAGQSAAPDRTPWDDGILPLFPLQPPSTGRELLVDHVTAMVCCAAMDTAGAVPGLDWLDGPSLLVRGERTADLASRVLSLVEEGDPAPLRSWLVGLGIRPEKPLRLA